MTTAGNIGDDKVVIHTPGPDLREMKDNNERKKTLMAAYTNTLKLILQYKTDEQKDAKISQQMKSKPKIDLHSVAFPPISMGIFCAGIKDFSKEDGAECALQAITNFAKENPNSGILEISFLFLPEDQDPDKLGAIFADTFRSKA